MISEEVQLFFSLDDKLGVKEIDDLIAQNVIFAIYLFIPEKHTLTCMSLLNVINKLLHLNF